ncbi:MAG: MFS transporter [Holosporaceae bacterium]|jgi:PAT family beta-lactamase induction signal transducer AmpG|nr:MFS transporter [Holosporaceae bacterium]
MKLSSSVGDFVTACFRAKIGSKFFLGFTCGLPFLLRLTVLDLWLRECGVSNSVIGFFTVLQWPFTLKFLWAPFIEKTDLPFLSKMLGRRRGWAIFSQILLFLGLTGMAAATPETNIAGLMLCVSVVALADGCQDISLYSYQLDKANGKTLGPIAGIFVSGYKSGMFFSKSVTLYLAHYFGWNFAYASMAFSVVLSTIFIFCADEPKVVEIDFAKKVTSPEKTGKSGLEFICTIKSAIFEYLVRPFQTFTAKKNWKQIISLIMLYRAGDRIIQKMAKLFYVDMGFSILEIANVVQVFGTIAALVGGILGGYAAKRFGIKRAMFFAGVTHAVGCFAYLILMYAGHNINVLYVTVFIENITGGAIATAFIAFLYEMCNGNEYASTRYALLWAFYEAGGIICRTMSGVMADVLGWGKFFFLVPFMFVPGLMILRRMINEKNGDGLRQISL